MLRSAGGFPHRPSLPCLRWQTMSGRLPRRRVRGIPIPIPTTILPFQPAPMLTAQLAPVSHLACYSGLTHVLDSFQTRLAPSDTPPRRRPHMIPGRRPKVL